MAEGITTRSLSEILNEVKVELREFVQTRLELLKSELRDKTKAWKMAAPMLLVAGLFGFVGFLCLTGALVCVISWATGSWGYAFLAVGLAWWAIMALVGFIGYREFTAAGMVPDRTVKVLKQDQAWIESERRAA